MKKVVLFLSFVVAATAAFSQIENPVKWTYTAKKTKAGLYEIHMTAVLDNKWHIYSQDAGDGPQATSFEFEKNPLVKTDGAVKEVGKLEKEYDPNFKSTLKFYSGKVDFVQTVKLKAAVATVTKGTVTYMVCNDKKCLPPRDVPFTVKIDPRS